MSAVDNASIPKWQRITGLVLSWILIAIFAPSAFMKIAQPGSFLAEWTKTYPAGAALPLGLIEITSYVLLLIPRTRVLGAMVLTGYLGGAVATHVHGGDGLFPVPIVVGIVIWASVYLRDLRVRALVPTVRD